MLIPIEPINMKVRHEPGEFIKVDRLYEIAVRVVLICLDEIDLRRGCREDHDGNKPERFIGFYLLEYFEPVYLGQPQIKKDYVGNGVGRGVAERAPMEKIVERGFSILYMMNCVSEVMFREASDHQFGMIQIVLYEKDVE
jgi:hypothetical protein